MYIGGDFAFLDIKANAGPNTKLFDYVEYCDHVINGDGDNCAIICVPFAGELEAARCDVIASA